MIKKYTYGYIICIVIGVLLITTTSNNTIAAQDQNNMNITTTPSAGTIEKQNQTNATTPSARLIPFSPVPFKEIPLAIINSVYHEDKFGADFSIDFGDETVIEQDFSASSVPNMRLNKDDTTLSLQLLCDSNDICDASLAPEKVKIYLADDEIQDIQIAENSFPTLELGNKDCGNLSIEDCANFTFSIRKNTILGNYKLVVEMSFEEAKWIFINPAEIVKSTYKVDTISGLGDGPLGIAYDSLHQRMYAANQIDSTVSVIDTITNKVIGNPIPVGEAASFLAYDPVHHRIYVTNQIDSTVSVIDTITNKVIDTDPNTPGINPITVVGGANAIAYDPVHKTMYVTNLTVPTSTIYVIDTNTMTVIDTIAIQAQLSGIEYDPVHQWMYVSNYVDANAVIVIDTNTNAVIGNPIPVGEGPNGMAFDPVNQRIYVAHDRDDTVYVINTNTNTVVDKIFVGSTTTNIAFDPINQRMYATQNMDNIVSVIDTTKNTVIDIISVGRAPMDIAYDPVNHRMYVPNYSDDTVSIVYL